jgi:hypothetical protein
MINEAHHLSISIARPADEVYDFVSQPQNLPLWASGLGAVSFVDNEWIAHAADSNMRLRFAERNRYGVLDHWLTTAGGTEIYVPLRVIANGSGCELTLALLRQPDMTDEKFAADADWIMRDLTTLKRLLEAGVTP